SGVSSDDDGPSGAASSGSGDPSGAASSGSGEPRSAASCGGGESGGAASSGGGESGSAASSTGSDDLGGVGGDSESPEADRGSKRSVLIVDDNQDSCTLLRMLLESIGCVVAVACSAQEALAAASSAPPDIAIIDLGLPDMRGDELVGELRSRPQLRMSRFICLSGRRESEVDWRAAGFDHFVQKPARFDVLKKLIEE